MTKKRKNTVTVTIVFSGATFCDPKKAAHELVEALDRCRLSDGPPQPR